MKVTVSGGDDSEAARAYALYYRAMMAGRLADGKKYVIEEQAGQMTGEDVDVFLDMFQENPKQLTITSVSEKADKATLQAEGVIAGCLEDGTAKATIEMVKQAGGWKVAGESWEMRGQSEAGSVPELVWRSYLVMRRTYSAIVTELREGLRLQPRSRVGSSCVACQGSARNS